MLKKIFSEEALITIFEFQFLIFYGTSDFTKPTEAPTNEWDKAWYVIEALNYAVIAVYFALRRKDIKCVVAWRLLALFFLIRLIWEIIAVRTGWSVNMKALMAGLFLLISTIIFFTISLPFLKKTWHRFL